MRRKKVEHVDEFAETQVLLPVAHQRPTDPDVDPLALYTEYERELARDAPPPPPKRG